MSAFRHAPADASACQHFSTPLRGFQHFSRVIGLARGSGETPRFLSRDGARPAMDEAEMLTSDSRRLERADKLPKAAC